MTIDQIHAQPIFEPASRDAGSADSLTHAGGACCTIGPWVNTTRAERLLSAALGAGLLAFGARRRGVTGVLLALTGASLLFRGSSGHCVTYDLLGLDRSTADREITK